MNESNRRNPARTGRLAAAVALLLAASAYGADLNFDIPAGDLKTALDAYVKQTGQQIVFKSDDVKGKTTSGVHGSLSDKQALDALLKGTGLQLRRDESGAVVVFPAEAVAGGASTQTAGTENKELEVIVVTATAISQLYTTSRTVTRIDSDPMLLPMSVSAVQEDLLRYQQATTVAEVLANVSGVDTAGDVGTSRGFYLTSARNGVSYSTNMGVALGGVPLVALERVEVVKGPEQILQGQTAGIGGTVNQVTKRPTPDDYAFLGAAAGSEGYYRLDADVNGTLIDGKYGRLMGEVIGSTSDEDSGPKSTVGSSTDFVSAGLRWENSEIGSDLSAVYQHTDTITATRPIALGGQHMHYGDPLYMLGDPGSRIDVSSDEIEVRFSQRIVGTWAFDFSYLWREDSGDNLDFGWFGVDAQVIEADQYRDHTVLSAAVYRAGVHGQVDIGPVTNKLLLAYDWQSANGASPRYLEIGAYINDIAAGTKDYVPYDPPVAYDPAKDSSDQTGVLLTDQVSWDKWHALLGVRWLSVTQKYMEGKPVYYTDKFTDSDAVPQYGLVYAVSPQLSLYASGTGGYRINTSYKDADGNYLPNTTYTQYEGGAKALLMDQQLALTVAIYQLEQKDVAVFAGFTSGGQRYYRAEPGITSKGVEVELSGQPIRGLQVRTTYAYMESESDTDGQPPFQGYTPSQLSLWSQYWFGRNLGHGWWAGGGLTAADAPVRRSGTGKLPGATVINLSAGYQQDHWQAIVGVKNVGNVEAFESIAGGPVFGSDYFYAYRLPSREYRFDLSYRF